MINKTVFLSLFALLLAMTACTSTPEPTFQPGDNHLPVATSGTDDTIYFPLQKKTNGEWATMDALMRGTLVLADNCIRIHNDEGEINYLLIWPPDFNITIENGTINILDGHGKIVAQIGDTVRISGGEIHLLSMLDKLIQEQVPPQYPGPFWIIGEEINIINTSK